MTNSSSCNNVIFSRLILPSLAPVAEEAAAVVSVVEADSAAAEAVTVADTEVDAVAAAVVDTVTARAAMAVDVAAAVDMEAAVTADMAVDAMAAMAVKEVEEVSYLSWSFKVIN